MQILLPLFTQGSSQECQSSIHLVICDWFRYDTRPKQKSPCVVLSCSGVNREILPLLLCSWNWKDRRVSSGLVQAHSHGCSRFSRQWVVHKVLSRPRLGTGTSVLLLHPVGQSTSPALIQRMRNFARGNGIGNIISLLNIWGLVSASGGEKWAQFCLGPTEVVKTE